MLKRLLISSAFALFFISAAAAADYCHYTPVSIYDGGTANVKLTVVVANVPRPVYPDHPADRPWCISRWRSLGAEDMPKILEKPALGELSVGKSRVSYKGNKVGHDHFVIEKIWYGPGNETRKATVIYDVDVVSGPF